MAEHLTPTGRAAIIVPEGIIFQSQTAYKELRKMLVENSLVAVVSLPAGCFNPYSRVKCSILILDKSLARQSDTIGFFKVENDGFGLGAQRRAIEKNDLPQVQAELAAYLQALRSKAPMDTRSLASGLIVPKEKIAANGDYNLSDERYRERATTVSSYPFVPLSDVARVKNGFAFKSEEYVDSGLRVIRIKNVQKGVVIDDDPKFMAVERRKEFADFALKTGDILMSLTGNVGRVGRLKAEHEPAVLNQRVAHIQLVDGAPSLSEYLFALLNTDKFEADAIAGSSGMAQLNLSSKWVGDYEIPLPPLEVQKEIVAEIEGYQKVINGARAVLDHYRPHIPIHPDWPMVALNEVIDELESGVSVNSENRPTVEGEVGVLKTSCVTLGVFDPSEHKAVLANERSRARCPVRGNTIIISRMNTEALVGANAYVPNDYPNLYLPDRLWQTVITLTDVEVRYVQTVISSDAYRERISALCGGTSGSMRNIAKPQLLSINIPLPPLATQQAIVAEIEAEQALVAANRELITRFEQKIQATLAHIWGEEKGED